MSPLIKKISIVTLSFILSLSFTFAFAAPQNKDGQVMMVYTSILPQRYFVEKIAGDRVEVKVLVGPGKSPATYEPTPQQVMGLGNAAVFFTIGVPFEQAFVPTISSTLTSLKISDTSKGIHKRLLEAHDSEEHGHHADAHEEEHEHHADAHGDHDHDLVHKEEHQDEHHHEEGHNHAKGAKDPHIWLSPRLAKIQAKTIYQTLVELDPKGKAVYQQGYNSLIKELNQIDVKLSKLLAPFKGKTMFVFHPAFGYFADDYQLKQVAIETGGKEPTPSLLTEIIEQAKEDNVRIIFVQPEFSQNAAQAIAQAINGAVVTISTLNPDYINNLSHIAAELEKAFRQQ